jgi:hypothetical protein
MPTEASQSPSALEAVRYEDKLLSPLQTAEWLLISQARLQFWARRNYGPPVIRVGLHKIAYRVGDILTWLKAQRGAPRAQRWAEKKSRKSA